MTAIDRLVIREMLSEGLIEYANAYPHFVCVKKIIKPTPEFYRILANDLHKLKRKRK